jgi:hypothetical protein
MARTIDSNPEVMEHAVSDGINIFVREVLIPRGLVDANGYEADDEVLRLKYAIAKNVAQSWQTCQLHEGP